MCRKAVLIIHGFGSGTWENEYLTINLQLTKRYDVYNFTLKGHSDNVIKDVKYTDWIDESEEMLKKVMKKYRKVYLIGHSMGGVIATHLATKYKISKLVLIAPAFNYTNFEQNKEDLVLKLKNKEKLIPKYEVYPDIFQGIFKVPPTTLLEFTRLVKNYKDDPKKVTCKTLVIQGDSDEFVKVDSSVRIYNDINTDKKTLLTLKDIKHRVFFSEKKELICDEINKFLKGGLKWTKKKNYEI